MRLIAHSAGRNWFADQGERARDHLILAGELLRAHGRDDGFLAAWIVSRLGGRESNFQY